MDQYGNEAEALLKVAEVAELLRLRPVSVYRLLASGTLPGSRVGGSWRVPRALLEAWLLAGGQGLAR